MMKRHLFIDQSKAKVALEALRGDKTIQGIAAKHGLHPNQVSAFKQAVAAGLHEVFAKSGKGKWGSGAVADEKEIDKLYATIGRLRVENDFLSEGLIL
jgi:transposase-like protein